MSFGSVLISEVGNIFVQSRDVSQLANASYLILTHIVQLIKHSYILFYNDRFIKLLKSINQTDFLPKNSKQQKTLDRYIQLSEIISLVGLGACFATCCFWTIDSLMEEKKVSLPLALWYPFDTEPSPVFEIIFAYQVLTSIVNAWANAAGDLIISGNT